MHKLFIIGMGHMKLTREAIIQAYELSHAQPLDAGRKCYFPSSKKDVRLVRYLPDDIAEHLKEEYGG